MIWPGEEVQAAEGEAQEDDAVDDESDKAGCQHGREEAAALQGRVDGEVGELRQQEGHDRGDTIAGGASKAEDRAPTAIAPSPTFVPRRRWTRSRSTSARPIISTPLGAMTPGATGTRQGPFGDADRADIADQPVGRGDGEREKDEATSPSAAAADPES